MTLTEAITAVEVEITDLASADGAQSAANAKFEQALTSKQAADAADQEAVTDFNAALQSLIDAATAAKR